MGLADDLIRSMQGGADDGLLAAAHLVAEQAKRNMPVGDPSEDPNPDVSLQDSVRVERDGRGYVVIVDAPYAAKQHENQRLKHPRGGGPKFLEHAVTELAPTLEGIIASKVDARTATGLTSEASRSHHRRRS